MSSSSTGGGARAGLDSVGRDGSPRSAQARFCPASPFGVSLLSSWETQREEEEQHLSSVVRRLGERGPGSAPGCDGDAGRPDSSSSPFASLLLNAEDGPVVKEAEWRRGDVGSSLSCDGLRYVTEKFVCV